MYHILEVWLVLLIIKYIYFFWLGLLQETSHISYDKLSYPKSTLNPHPEEQRLNNLGISRSTSYQVRINIWCVHNETRIILYKISVAAAAYCRQKISSKFLRVRGFLYIIQTYISLLTRNIIVLPIFLCGDIIPDNTFPVLKYQYINIQIGLQDKKNKGN